MHLVSTEILFFFLEVECGMLDICAGAVSMGGNSIHPFIPFSRVGYKTILCMQDHLQVMEMRIFQVAIRFECIDRRKG